MPARNQIEVTPGEKTKPSQSAFIISPTIPFPDSLKQLIFIVEDSQGTPRFIENAEDAPAKYSASRWLTLPYDRATFRPMIKL